MNEKLIAYSKSLSLHDSPLIPIEIGEAVIMRKTGRWWEVVVYLGYNIFFEDTLRFRAGEGQYSMMAPLPGNESAIGTDGDVFGLIDQNFMREKGLI